MNINDFYAMVKIKGALIDITRPSTGDTFKVYMARHTGAGDQTLLEEGKQYDETFVICRLDFDGKPFTSPREGDRILDSDGLTEFAIERKQRLIGISNETWGWNLVVRG